MVLGFANPVAAQEIPPPEPSEDRERTEQTRSQNHGLQTTSRTADTGIGEVGQRQTVRVGPAMREPLDRIGSRINNRVQNRIRNRIDRNYNPTANATSPFVVAEEQARTAGQTGPR